MKWESDSNRGAQAKILKLGPFPVGKVFYDATRAKDEPRKYMSACALPGVRGVLGWHETEESAMKKVEGGVRWWLKGVSPKAPLIIDFYNDLPELKKKDMTNEILAGAILRNFAKDDWGPHELDNLEWFLSQREAEIVRDMSKWGNLRDENPPIGEYVSVFSEGYIGTARIIEIEDDGHINWECWDDAVKVFNINYWRALPEKPDDI